MARIKKLEDSYATTIKIFNRHQNVIKNLGKSGLSGFVREALDNEEIKNKILENINNKR